MSCLDGSIDLTHTTPGSKESLDVAHGLCEASVQVEHLVCEDIYLVITQLCDHTSIDYSVEFIHFLNGSF